MADWSKPALSDTYAAVMSMFNCRDLDAAAISDTRSAVTNPFGLMKRWDNSAGKFECYSSGNASWNGMAVAIVGGGTGATVASSARASLGVPSSSWLSTDFPTSSTAWTMTLTHSSDLKGHGATVTKTASRIPLSDGNGLLDSWVSPITFAISYTFDGGGATIPAGTKGYLEIPFGVTSLCGYTVLADAATASQVDVWKDTYANFPPVDADSITASAPVRCGSSGGTSAKGQDTSLTGWTKTITSGDVVAFNVDSNTAATRLLISIKCQRTVG
jgi:hypothetical protein